MSVTTRTNLATNPNVTSNASLAAVPGTGGTATGAYNSGTGYDGGAGFWRVSWTVATTAISGGGSYTQTGLSASTQYTHSLYVRSSVAQTVSLTAQYQDPTSTNVGAAVTGSNVSLTANTWAQISVTATSGLAVDRVVLTAAATTGGVNWANGNTFDMDCILIEAAATVGNFFDGSYVAGLGVTYAWTGGANVSTSTATTYSPVLTLAAQTTPCDSVQVTITDLQPVTQSVTVWRTTDGVRRPIRSYRKVNVTGSDSVVDYEAGLGRINTYDLEVVSGPGVGGSTATATITINAATGWIQDPLDPSSAIQLLGTDNSLTGAPTLTYSALKSLEMQAGINLVEILGASEPVALVGQRLALKGVSFAMVTNAAQQATNLRNLIKQTPLLLIRPLPAWSSALPGLCYTAAPIPVELPVNEAWGGSLIEWKFETGLVRPQTMNIVLPVWKYSDWQALFNTYQDAQTTLSGKTYLQVKQRPATG